MQNSYGILYPALSSQNKILYTDIVIENELMKVYISPLGGRISSVELKNQLRILNRRLLKEVKIRICNPGNLLFITLHGSLNHKFKTKPNGITRIKKIN